MYEYIDSTSQWEPLGNAIQGQGLGRWFANTVCLSSNGHRVAVALWCDAPHIEPCDYGGMRVYSFIANKKIWAQMGVDFPGQTLYDPQAESVDMAKDEMLVVTGVAGGLPTVTAYRRIFSD